MSKSLSVASVIEKNRLSSDVPWLVCLDIDVIDPETAENVQTLHFVLNNEAITWNGHLYGPAVFDVSLKEESGALTEIQLTFVDYSRAVQQYMQRYRGGVGFTVALSVVNAGNLAQGPEVQEFFEVIAAESKNYECIFTLGAENMLTKTFPRRRQTRDYCQFRYKSEACGYTGPLPSCDLSLRGANGCQAHGNVIRFGAYPGINGRDVRYG